MTDLVKEMPPYMRGCKVTSAGCQVILTAFSTERFDVIVTGKSGPDIYMAANLDI